MRRCPQHHGLLVTRVTSRTEVMLCREGHQVLRPEVYDTVQREVW